MSKKLVVLKNEKKNEMLLYKARINELYIELHKQALSPHQYRHKFLESICYKNKLRELKFK